MNKRIKKKRSRRNLITDIREICSLASFKEVRKVCRRLDIRHLRAVRNICCETMAEREYE